MVHSTLRNRDPREGRRGRLTSLMEVLVVVAAIGCLAGAGTALAREKKTAETEGGWPEITKEERALERVPQDPDADAVVLRWTRTGKIVKPADRFENIMQYHWRMKVLTDAGKEYAEVRIRARKGSRVKDIEARTIKPDGTIIEVTPDQMFERVVFEVGDFKLTEWVFHFPAVEPGSILEYRYERRSRYLVFVTPWYFETPVFTLYSKVSQAVPHGTSYMVLCDLCEGSEPVITKWREGKQKGQLYTMELKNRPGYREEILMPPQREVSPRLELLMQSWKGTYWWALGRSDRLFTDWESVSKYADYYYNGAIKEGKELLKPAVDGWVQGIEDPGRKIQEVFRHVQQDFRYIPYTTVVGGSRSIESILDTKRADNEEKAVLLCAALEAIGIESKIALVSGKHYGSVNPNFFSLSQFTHAVVMLPKAGAPEQILDPTVSYSPFGFMPWKDSGAQMLVLEGKGGELGKLPVKNELSITKHEITLTPRSDGKADLVVESNYTGEDAIDWRENLVPASESGREDVLKGWLDRVRPGTLLKAYSLENLDNPEEPLEIRVEATGSGLVTLAGDVMAVRGCVLTGRETNPISRGSRQHPFYVDRGWNVQENVQIVPPEGMRIASVPPPSMARSAIGSASLQCMSRGEEGARCSRQFLVRRNRWSAAERDSIRTMFDQIVEADGGTVAFESAAGGGN